MHMHRFFIDPAEIGRAPEEIVLQNKNTKHLQVLRLRPGERVVVCDGKKTDYTCELMKIDQTGTRLKVLDFAASAGEPHLEVTLFQCLPKHDKMETIVQKAVEAGVCRIVPVISERVDYGPGRKTEQKRERWQKIALAAAEQCGRGIVPEVNGIVPMLTALKMATGLGEAYAAYENEKNVTAAQAFIGSSAGTAGIFIGPEGGFSDEEAALFRERRIRTFSLGKRVLRTETAGFAAAFLFLFCRGAIS